MIGVGVFGLFFCLWVAILAVMATRTPSGCCSVWFYSTCSALLNLIFSGIGIVFIAIGLASSASFSPVAPFMGDDGVDCPVNFAKLVGMESNGDKATQCILDALCKALDVVLGRTTVLGFGIGIPFFVAGTAMFIACYACCCCKSQFSADAAANANANTADTQDNDDDFPGAEFYPPPAEAVPPMNDGTNKQSPQTLTQPGIYPSAY